MIRGLRALPRLPSAARDRAPALLLRRPDLQRGGDAARAGAPPRERPRGPRRRLGGDPRRRRERRPHRRARPRPEPARPALQASPLHAQLRAPDGDHRRPRPRARRRRRHHGRRPAGPAGGGAGADRALARGLRGRLCDPAGPLGRAVAAPDGDLDLLPHPAPPRRRRHPARRGRLPARRPARARAVPAHAREQPLRPRALRLDRLPPDRRPVQAGAPLCRRDEVSAREAGQARRGRHRQLLEPAPPRRDDGRLPRRRHLVRARDRRDRAADRARRRRSRLGLDRRRRLVSRRRPADGDGHRRDLRRPNLRGGEGPPALHPSRRELPELAERQV